MHDIDELIAAAWRRVKPRLEHDQHDLAARLQRRRTPTLMRPPRAWCIALRASDHRISAQRSAFSNQPSASSPIHHSSFSTHHSSSPPHPDSTEEIVITANLLRQLTQPVHLSRDYLNEAADKLGTTPAGLTSARIKGNITAFHMPLMGGRHGKPIPMLSTGVGAGAGGGGLDPQAHLFAKADRAWSWTACSVTARIPPDLRVTLTREPFFRGHVWKHRYDENRHPEIDAVPPLRKSQRLPPPEEDVCCWYKWSRAGHYLGNDPSNWRKHPDDLGLRPRRDLPKRKRYGKPRPSQSRGSEHFNGYHWLCPVCQKRCRKLYYPLPPINLIKDTPRLAQIVDIPRKVTGFACRHCHRIKNFSRLQREAWNDLIAYLTQGLLYGREVPRPSWFTRDRKTAYTPRPNARPSLRRPQVTELLLQGHTYAAIGQQLGLTERTINDYASKIYARHNVHGRNDLAAKLRVPLAKPPTKQAQVRVLLDTGLSYRQISTKLGLTHKAVQHHGAAIRREQKRSLATISV